MYVLFRAKRSTGSSSRPAVGLCANYLLLQTQVPMMNLEICALIYE